MDSLEKRPKIEPSFVDLNAMVISRRCRDLGARPGQILLEARLIIVREISSSTLSGLFTNPAKSRDSRVSVV